VFILFLSGLFGSERRGGHLIQLSAAAVINNKINDTYRSNNTIDRIFDFAR